MPSMQLQSTPQAETTVQYSELQQPLRERNSAGQKHSRDPD